ncbi:hypothetical protein B0H10DRAFT_760238 [Mycena sp. CBHHK59/15]|nr:hypothetical protein B0H10DRAFT_760238 [Mycena sp. CBHHK59/15]
MICGAIQRLTASIYPDLCMSNSAGAIIFSSPWLAHNITSVYVTDEFERIPRTRRINGAFLLDLRQAWSNAADETPAANDGASIDAPPFNNVLLGTGAICNSQKSIGRSDTQIDQRIQHWRSPHLHIFTTNSAPPAAKCDGCRARPPSPTPNRLSNGWQAGDASARTRRRSGRDWVRDHMCKQRISPIWQLSFMVRLEVSRRVWWHEMDELVHVARNTTDKRWW